MVECLFQTTNLFPVLIQLLSALLRVLVDAAGFLAPLLGLIEEGLFELLQVLQAGALLREKGICGGELAQLAHFLPDG